MAGSVMGRAIGRKPYFSLRNRLTSNQPSSGEKNFEDSSAVPVATVWAEAAGERSATAMRARTEKRIGMRGDCSVFGRDGQEWRAVRGARGGPFALPRIPM